MKFALVDSASGLVKQWQDDSLFGYAPPGPGEERKQLADNFVFPSTQHWCVSGQLTDTDPSATPAALLAQAQVAQIGKMATAYQGAIAQDVDFTTAVGTAKTYQADSVSVGNAQAMLAAYTTHGVPSGFYWVAKDNTQVPFTLADLQGLSKAMGDQGWAAFQKLQARKASILAASSIAAAQAVAW